MEQTLQDFEKAWRHFETNFKGRLLEKSKTQPLGLSQANLILKDASSDWFSGYGAEGKWLRDYKGLCPAGAETVTSILRHEMRLGNESAPRGQGAQVSARDKLGTSNMKYIVPAAGAIIGGVIASAVSAGVLVSAVAMAAPAVLLYSRMQKNPTKAASAARGGTGINDYVAQLQVYREKIVAVIETAR